MDTVIALLNAIPDIVWSGLLASAVTLLGVFASNKSNAERLALQLEHESAEKSKERIATLRRDVYLRGVEELVNANAYLGSLTQTDLTKVNVGQGLQPFFAAAARLQLVAEPKTALLANELVGSYGELLFRILGELTPIQNAKSDIQMYDDLYMRVQAQLDRVLADMAKIHESGQRNDSAFHALGVSYESHRGQASEYAAARSAAWDRYNKAQVTFIQFLLPQIKVVSAQSLPVVVEIRRDLGLTADLQPMEAQMQVQHRRMENSLNALLSKLSAG